MKKRISKLFLAGFLLASFFIMPITAIALPPGFVEPVPVPEPDPVKQITSQGGSGNSTKAPDFKVPVTTPVFNLQFFLENIAGWIFWIVMMIAFIFIVISGYTFITASGNPEKITKAKNMLIYALIGVAVALLAWALISWVATFLGVEPVPLQPTP